MRTRFLNSSPVYYCGGWVVKDGQKLLEPLRCGGPNDLGPRTQNNRVPLKGL